MKKIYSLVVLMMLALTGCSSDDKGTVYNDTAEDTGRNLKLGCAIFGGNESAFAQSSTPGAPVTFVWDYISTVYVPNRTYTYQVEINTQPIFQTACSTPPITRTLPFSSNTITTVTANPGINAPCFYWRIVIKGYERSKLVCNSETNWFYFSY